MNREEVFSVWAPADSLWSPWVAPVLFAQTLWDARVLPELVVPTDLSWLPDDVNSTAFVVDLPGADSIQTGFALAARGCRPIPLYNASPGPEHIGGPGDQVASPWNAVIDMSSIVDAISRVTSSLQALQLPPDAPPAFLLDSLRLSGIRPANEGMFDNRWLVIPQDFPSADFLAAQGIKRALLIQKDRFDPQNDLAHVLLRWQERGIEILAKNVAAAAPARKITVKRPSHYKAFWYRALALLGLRRSSAGGFGSYIPEATGAG